MACLSLLHTGIYWETFLPDIYLVALWGCSLVNNYEGPSGRAALCAWHTGNVLLPRLWSQTLEKLLPRSSQKLLCGPQAHPAASGLTKLTGSQQTASGPSARLARDQEHQSLWTVQKGQKPATILSKTKCYLWFSVISTSPWFWKGKGVGILLTQTKLFKLFLLPL